MHILCLRNCVCTDLLQTTSYVRGCIVVNSDRASLDTYLANSLQSVNSPDRQIHWVAVKDQLAELP